MASGMLARAAALVAGFLALTTALAAGPGALAAGPGALTSSTPAREAQYGVFGSPAGRPSGLPAHAARQELFGSSAVLPSGPHAPEVVGASAALSGPPVQEGRREVFGHSAGGQPLTVYWVGEAGRAVVVQGALHGGPEANTSALTYQLRDHFLANPDEIPPGFRLAFIPEANPDGLAAGTRLYLSGVDPNRNWDTPDWESDAYDSNGAFRRGLGGPTPMSEPETRQFAAWVLDLQPAAVIQYHSRGGFVVGARELSEPYAAASGYYVPAPPTPGGSGTRLLSYRATGTLGRWLNLQSIPSILIELTNYTDPEFRRNLAGLRAVLRTVAAVAQAPEDAPSLAAPAPY
jgi:hypothetical protein